MIAYERLLARRPTNTTSQSTKTTKHSEYVRGFHQLLSSSTVHLLDITFLVHLHLGAGRELWALTSSLLHELWKTPSTNPTSIQTKASCKREKVEK